jgi:hypothetical protein
MTRLKYAMLILVLTMLAVPLSRAKATPSSGFTQQNGDWYDSFGIDRNAYDGAHGYLPNLAYETLGSNQELAYSIGESFKQNYVSTSGRAEAILKFVQTWTEYGYDSDNVVKDGVPQDEWAWNADEMAHKFDQNSGVKAVGDCEDMAFLCATIYTGAGIDAAVVDAPGHVACLIWLPDYANADYYWNLPNDNRNGGWIWVEATGSSNPLGWTPPDFTDGNWNAYPIGAQQNETGTTPPPTNTQTEPFPTDIAVIGVIAVAVLLVLLIAGSKRKKKSYPPVQGWEYPPPPPPM